MQRIRGHTWKKFKEEKSMGQPEREREERIRIPPSENLMTLKSKQSHKLHGE